MTPSIALKKELWQPLTEKTVDEWQSLPYHLAEKTYEHRIETWLKDSNAYANTYFSRYFEWQGICREAWFFRCISADMLQSLGVFITKKAHNDYVQETFPFQTIRAEVNTALVKQASFYILFRFFNEEDRLVSGGFQQIVFADHAKKISRLPDTVLRKVAQYEVPLRW